MRRREFIGLLGGAAVWPLGVRGQQSKRLLGIVGANRASPFVQTFLERLRVLGWIEGQNILIEARGSATASPDSMVEAAAELVAMNVDVIFAPASPQVEGARKATKIIPIVFAAHGDPVGVGHVANLARPGGNITGSSNLVTELSTKDLDVLREAIPNAIRIGILWDPTAPAANYATITAVEGTATNMGYEVRRGPVRAPEEFNGALASMAQAGVAAFLAIASPLTFNNRTQLGELSLKYRLASVFSAKENVRAGGLLSYGPIFDDLARRGADYVDKILRGANPADLPVEQASKYELVINLKTAKALGLTIPPALLVRADEVIE